MQAYKCMYNDVSNGALTLILFETDNTEDDKRTWTKINPDIVTALSKKLLLNTRLI